MDPNRLTRRALVRLGIASTIAGGAAALASESASAARRHNDLIVGRFIHAHAPRLGTVSLPDGESVSVALDSRAYVAQGLRGLVDSLVAFVPGEQVAVRGSRSETGIAVDEFQSVYTLVTGTIEADGPGYVLMTSFGRVSVPRDVVRRNAPSGVHSGETYSASIWTHPATGEATALDLCGGN
jgi:hypothetical protein